MDKEILDQITLKMGIISGFVFLAIIIPLRIYWRKNALDKIKSLLDEDENLLYQVKFPFSLDYLATFCCGGFFGSFLLPFTVFSNVNNVGIVNKISLFYFVPAELLFLFVILAFSSWAEIITNKKIRRHWDLKIFNKIGKPLDLSINEIKSVNYQKIFIWEAISIITKDNQFYSLGGYKNMSQVNNYLTNYKKLS